MFAAIEVHVCFRIPFDHLLGFSCRGHGSGVSLCCLKSVSKTIRWSTSIIQKRGTSRLERSTCYSTSPANHINRRFCSTSLHEPVWFSFFFLFSINSITVASLSNIIWFPAPLSGSRSCGWAHNNTPIGDGSTKTSGAPRPLCSASGLATGTTSSSGRSGRSAGFLGWYKVFFLVWFTNLNVFYSTLL